MQKGSQYLDDANKLIDLAKQLDIINLAIQKHIPNATKCSTWSAVHESHWGKGELAEFKVENIFGIMILLAIGLGGSLIIAVLECIYSDISVKKGIDSVIVMGNKSLIWLDSNL